MCLCIRVSMCIYIYMCEDMHRIPVSMYLCVDVNLHLCIYVSMSVYMCMYICKLNINVHSEALSPKPLVGNLSHFEHHPAIILLRDPDLISYALNPKP